MHGIILADNRVGDTLGAMRGTGAHRIATHLRNNGYQIEVVDFFGSWQLDQFELLCKKLVTKELLFLGISGSLFAPGAPEKVLLDWFNETYPHIPIIVGGTNVLHKDIPHVDYYLEGYAEDAMIALLGYLQGKNAAPKFSDKFPNVKLIDCNKDYGNYSAADLTITYTPSDFMNGGIAGLETARGCIFKCKFCNYPLIGKHKLDYMRDPHNIKLELEENYYKWGISNYIITEDTFNDHEQKVANILEATKQLPFKLKFVSYLRLDLLMAKPHTAQMLKDIGIAGCHFGIETLNRKAGMTVGKGLAPEKIKEGLAWWKNLVPDSLIGCSFIVGLPYENKESLQQTFDYIQTSPIDRAVFFACQITNDEKTLISSEFSRNYSVYGYEEMTEQEISNYCTDNNIAFDQYIRKEYVENSLYWKNKYNGLNYIECTDIANTFNSLNTKRRNPWMLMQILSAGYDYNHIASINWDASFKSDLKRTSQQAIQNYISSKLLHNYNTIG